MLRIRQLHYRYPKASVSALHDVNLDAARGQVLGLLGPNGAGKTTLIAQLAGMLAVQQGQIQVDGQDLAELRKRRPTCIAIAPQEYAFYPTLTVQENLDCFAGVGGLRASQRYQRVQACLDTAQLQAYRKVQGQHLSGGLKRRLNLAIALLHEPELILFDEPTVGVDPQSRAFLLDAVQALARQGTAVIYTSHYMEEVQAIADRIAVLDRGQVLCQGTLAELLGGGQGLTVEVDTDAQAQVQTLLACHGSVTVQGRALHVALHDASAVGALLAQLGALPLTLHRVVYGQTNLEQLFMSLTQRSLRD